MMKKSILMVVFMISMMNLASAQEALFADPSINKWSLEGGVGVTKPYRNFSSGYAAATPDFLSTEFGVRYMFNDYFGMRLGFGYNQFTNADSKREFTTDEYRLDFQGVVNMGRVLRFENWTQTFNVLAHGGVGVGQLDYETTNIDGDRVGNVIGGITGQVKISPRVAVNLDFSGFANIRQNKSFNGGIGNNKNLGVVFNSTVGLAIYLGKNKAHGDWYARETENYKFLNSKVASTDTKMKETEEKVEAASKEVEKVQASVEDLGKQVEQINEQLAAQNEKSKNEGYKQYIAQLIKDGYVNIYFDFNSTSVNKSALSAVNFLKLYLKNNPQETISLLGYADETGPDDYNLELSKKRAQAVFQLLATYGIDESRMRAYGKGEDASIQGNSVESNKLARRVSFELNGMAEEIDTQEKEYEKSEGVGDAISLNVEVKPVHFVEGKCYLTDFSKGRLDQLLTLLEQHPEYGINMYAYTDNQSGDTSNKQLCNERMETVIGYLKSKGLDESRIQKMEAMGATKPIASNETKQGRLLNRRIEFEILKIQ